MKNVDVKNTSIVYFEQLLGEYGHLEVANIFTALDV